MVLIGFGFYFHYNASIHLKETAVGVPGELCIAGLLGKCFNDFVVNPEIEDGVHHAGHRLTRPGANGEEKRILEIPKFLPHGLFDLGNIRLDFGIQSLGILLTVIVVVGANFRRDGETSRNGNSDTAHFGEVCTFTPKESFHRSISVALSCAEVIDILVLLTSGSFATSRSLFAGCLTFGCHLEK